LREHKQQSYNKTSHILVHTLQHVRVNPEVLLNRKSYCFKLYYDIVKFIYILVFGGI